MNREFIPEKDIPIYFVTEADGIKALWPKTLEVTTVINTTENLFGIAYDTARNHLYWTSGFQANKSSKIYRSKVEADGMAEMLLSTSQCELLFLLRN